MRPGIGAKDVVYRPLRSVPFEGQTDNRFYSPARDVDVPLGTVSAESLLTGSGCVRIILFLHTGLPFVVFSMILND